MQIGEIYGKSEYWAIYIRALIDNVVLFVSGVYRISRIRQIIKLIWTFVRTRCYWTCNFLAVDFLTYTPDIIVQPSDKFTFQSWQLCSHAQQALYFNELKLDLTMDIAVVLYVFIKLFHHIASWSTEIYWNNGQATLHLFTISESSYTSLIILSVVHMPLLLFNSFQK
jgi:hypothetical protein